MSVISQAPIRIAITAGEVSGDNLGESLIEELRKLYPNAKFEGIAGPKMRAVGCEAIFNVEDLSVMGIVEVLGSLKKILRLRKAFIKHLINNPPAVFIGIDAPDFNLGVERKCRNKGIPTVHYNSPTVWAWRKYRLKKIARSTDLMLTLFPFENVYYEEENIPAVYVGHPLADQISMENEKQVARELLGLNKDAPVIALLPGSRKAEIHQLSQAFIKTAKICLEREPNLQFVTPMVNDIRLKQFSDIYEASGIKLPITIFKGKGKDAMLAADAVLLASGTATLEAALLKRPMVMAYRVSYVTFALCRPLVRIKHFSLPNLLSGKLVVPEFIQWRVDPKTMANKLLPMIVDSKERQSILKEFRTIHERLRCNASEKASAAIGQLIEKIT